MTVYAGALHDGTPCWTFVTAGLAAKHHPELVLSLAMRKGEVSDDRGPWIDDLRQRIERLPAVVVTGEVSPSPRPVRPPS